jgi:hypothetical protein
MEYAVYRFLDIALQIYEDIAAGNKVNMGKGRVSKQVMRRKRDDFPDCSIDSVTAVLLGKKLPEALVR